MNMTLFVGVMMVMMMVVMVMVMVMVTMAICCKKMHRRQQEAREVQAMLANSRLHVFSNHPRLG